MDAQQVNAFVIAIRAAVSSGDRPAAKETFAEKRRVRRRRWQSGEGLGKCYALRGDGRIVQGIGIPVLLDHHANVA